MFRVMWLDVIALFLLVLFAFLGARRGGLASGLGLLTLGVGYGAAVFFGARYADTAAEAFGVSPMLGMPLAGSIAFLGAFVAMSILSKVLRALEAEHPSRSAQDRFFGGFFGAVRGGLIVLLLSYLAIWVDAMRVTGTAPDLPELGSSAAAALTESVVEAGVTAAMGDSHSGRIVAHMASRPGEAIVEMQELMENPVISEIQNDPMFWTYVEHGSIDAAMNRRGMLALTYNHDMRKTLHDFGLIDAAAVEDAELFREQTRGVLRELGPRLSNIKNDPKMQELMEDPEVLAAVQAGDHLTLMTHPGFQEVVARVMAEVD
jgi:uncharacterized membrane protein required for colicin V production